MMRNLATPEAGLGSIGTLLANAHTLLALTVA